MGLSSLAIALNAGSVWAASRVTLSFGLLERSVSTESLQNYAVDGVVDQDLSTYLKALSPLQQRQLRSLLQTQADLPPLAVSQFLYTDQGEILLQELGEVIRTESNLSGFYALRSALILAAADSGRGLSLLNVLEKFPLASIRIDLGRAFQLWADLEKLVRQTQDAIVLINQIAETEAAVPLGPSTAQDLQSPGPFTWEIRTLQLNDRSRQRSFPADIYLPVTKTQLPVLAAPLIVISHGLGSDRTTYAYLAKQLASYGFGVAVPEHPGSNSEQLKALISGQASQVTSPSEFVNRPLDIRYLLDTLEARTQSDPDYVGRLNLQHVGIVGQSMGGYTALALAGAQINFQQLATDCTSNTFNLSLLLQCRALELPQPAPNFRDDRVKAVIAINPIGSSLVGEADYAAIQIPVMLVSGSADTIAPALFEQIRPFSWLQTPNKYFLLMEGGTHFSTIDVPDPDAAARGELVQLPASIVGPDPGLAQTYMKAMSVAFFRTYIADQPDYASYLSAEYAQSISRRELPIYLVRSLDSNQLAGLLKGLRQKQSIDIAPVQESSERR